ncbi:CDK2-associated and cullin domain-containing protein 1-like [Orbicella faveolata]|uniref:CDK2-associated and cullin domain-containing protein 1-like n=1 Tax=Orbicella faveolata TaxID=48498 RepID=UPI0009E4FFB6|nr:CDK2-associated and cullin domain-containing protein 1-like [Orbicella faveolata]
MTTESVVESPQLRLSRVTSVNDEDYASLHWPKLEGAIQLILQQNPGEFIPISYEEMYSTVYKCVCQQYADKMYCNLIELVTSYLKRVAEELQVNNCLQNRFYVIPKLHTDLKTELWKLFTNLVADNTLLFEVIEQVSSRPFGVDPQVMMSIIKGLYSLKPEFSTRNPVLFARFIPNLLPPTQCDQLPSIIQEDRLLQENLVTSQGFTREDTGKKRRGEDFHGR